MSLTVALVHRFPALTIDVEFTVSAPGVTALFGPSGSGKSTIIAAIAGLLRPEQASINLSGTQLASADLHLPPERRRVGLVFQDSRLFPHLSVATNLRYGHRRAPAGKITFDDVVHLLGIEHLLHRRPAGLSGGERGRVAIGRALLSQPRLLLMDEPLAGLDRARRLDILPYLARLKTRLDLPILYVTHDLDEVVRLADTLVLLDAGRITASGAVTAMLARADLALAQRDDAAAVLHGHVAGHDSRRRLTTVQAAGRDVTLSQFSSPIGAPVRLRLPAREVALATRPPEAISLHNCIPAVTGALIHDPATHTVIVELALDGGALLARVTPDAIERLGLRTGSPVLALFKATSVEPIA